jgi:cytochrome b subunit of formate dehydrogenase
MTRDDRMPETSAHQIALWFLAALAILGGVIVWANAPTAAQEIVAAVVLLIAAVFVTGAMLVGVLHHLRLDLWARTTHAETRRSQEADDQRRVTDSLSDGG